MAPYVSVEELKAEAQSDVVVTTYSLDAIYCSILEAVTQAIDNYTFRSFGVPEEASARRFRPTNPRTEVDDLPDIATTSQLAVAVDLSGTGSFTTLTLDSDYFVETDRLGMVTAIRSTSRFPSSRVRPQSIEVTARWGWPETPDPVRRACMLWALRLVNRKSSPSGVMGFGDFGAIRLSSMDPDVRALLGPYRDTSRLLR